MICEYILSSNMRKRYKNVLNLSDAIDKIILITYISPILRYSLLINCSIKKIVTLNLLSWYCEIEFEIHKLLAKQT